MYFLLFALHIIPNHRVVFRERWSWKIVRVTWDFNNMVTSPGLSLWRSQSKPWVVWSVTLFAAYLFLRRWRGQSYSDKAGSSIHCSLTWRVMSWCGSWLYSSLPRFHASLMPIIILNNVSAEQGVNSSASERSPPRVFRLESVGGTMWIQSF
jgi:hypothetical protein